MLPRICNHRFIILVTMSLILEAFTHAPPAHADYVSQPVSIDQSNTMKDGVVYGSVLVEAYNGVGAAGGGLNAGEVRLTYSASAIPDYGTISKTFGIGEVGFNTDLALSSGQITGPAGWKLDSAKTISGFGKFSWGLQGNAEGGSRPNPVTVLITGLGADATLEHFLLGSVGAGKNPPSEGSVFFAMHVAGFETPGASPVGSHFVGGSGVNEPPPPGGSGEDPPGDPGNDPPPPGGGGEVRPTPEPSALLLAGISAGCVGFYRWSVRRTRA
jgi:hypothetical protein